MVGFRTLSARSKLALLAATLLLVLAVVPLWPWRPACRCETVWRGDLRDVYVDQFAKALDREDVYYWRVGDLILLRALPWFDGNEILSREDAMYNAECKLAESLSDDQIIDGVLYPAPEAVKRLKVELEPKIGPDTRFNPDGTRAWYGSDTRVRYSCPLFRASILEPPRPRER